MCINFSLDNLEMKILMLSDEHSARFQEFEDDILKALLEHLHAMGKILMKRKRMAYMI